jgi:gamma-D-glutamyl-L-lysine dipeptidyl-peptidase
MRGISPSRLALACAALLLALSCGPLATKPAMTVPPSGAPAHSGLQVPPFVDDTIAAIRADYAPDRRVARFDLDAAWSDGRLVMTGVTDQPAALARLSDALAAHGVDWQDDVRRLPDLAAVGLPWALVNNSVANLRTDPRHSAELATQAPLGTPLRMLDRDGGWLLVQGPDGYLAWVDSGAIEALNDAELAAHRRAEKVIYLEPAGVAVSEPRPGSAPISDLVAGAMLVREGSAAGYHRVRFPDGREAHVPESEAVAYSGWVAGVRATEESLVASAVSLLGRPYLWGGTSPNGMDCSGFTKTVYLLNGLVLPRDASQQVHAGALVDDIGDFSRLRPGDLLFFGPAATATSPERVVHVGLWMGGGRFIHSSGRVRIGSVDPVDPLYDDYNTKRYLRTKRMLGDGWGVHRLAEDALYPTDGRFAPSATAGPAVR